MKTKAINLDDKHFKYTLWDRFTDLEPLATFIEWVRRVGKIIHWIPVLWNDFDWESTHILRILEHKLSRVQKALEEDPYHCDSRTGELSGPILAKEVQEARDCIKRILDHDYTEKEQEAHDNKHGKLDMLINRNDVTYGKVGKPLTVGTTWINDGSAARRSLHKIWKLKEKREKDDYKKLFKILEEKSGGWWV